MEQGTLPLNPLTPKKMEDEKSELKKYIIWISLAVILFLLLAYFIPIVPCKNKITKTSLTCTPELEELGECVYQETFLSSWKLCSLKNIFKEDKESFE